MYKDKLSIIIPTRNRQVYALNCIKTILEISKGDYEIIVQDNSDEPSLKEDIDFVNDDHIIYDYCKDPVSFCDNFERGVSNSSGDYIIIIGDDDCVLPSIFDLVPILRKNNIDAVSYSLNCNYKWANSVNENKSSLTIRKDIPFIKIKRTNSAIKKMVSSGNFDYQKYNFPKVYHGIIKRDKLDEVKKITGHYFYGLTPDIYSAIALSFVIDKVLYINYPFSLPGMCPRSGTADSLTGKHTGSLSKAPHFRGINNYEWEKEVPYLYSVQTIWAETAIKAIKSYGNNFQFTQKQYYKFMTVTAWQCPTLKKEIINNYSSIYNKNIRWVNLKFFLSICIIKIRYLFRKCFSIFKQIILGRKTYYDANNINDAVNIISKKLTKYEKTYNLIRKNINEVNK